MSATLQQLRNHIDRVDRHILRLLNTRAKLAIRVGLLKKRKGLNLFDPGREQIILHALTHANHGPLPPQSVRAIYREILRQARRLEQEIFPTLKNPSKIS